MSLEQPQGMEARGTGEDSRDEHTLDHESPLSPEAGAGFPDASDPLAEADSPGAHTAPGGTVGDASWITREDDEDGEDDTTAPGRSRGLETLVAVHEDGRDRVEALVFSSEQALDETRIAELLAFTPEQVLECMRRLNEDYAAQGRSFQLRRLAGGWQLVSRPRYADDIRRLLKVSIRQRLSRAALETLAVIAYKQPLTKAEIESIRGVAADGVLKTLLDRHLVTIAGRSKGVGKPLLYATTREFLEYFGLEDLDGLPRLKEIKELMQGRDPGEEGLPTLPLGELLPPVSGSPDEEGEEPDWPAPDTNPGSADGFDGEPDPGDLPDEAMPGKHDPPSAGDHPDTDDPDARWPDTPWGLP